QRECKHVVAALLASNVMQNQSARRPAPETAPEAAAPAATPARRSAPSWRSLVSSTDAVGTVPIALGIELRHRDGHAGAHWGARPARTATPRDLDAHAGELTLGVRPLMSSPQTGSWIRGQAGWDSARRDTTMFGHART